MHKVSSAPDSDLRGGQSGHTHSKVSHFAAFQSSSLVNSDLRIHITPWDQRQIDTSQHDLVVELKEQI